ncbi:MAG: hypothetical protein LYZ66_00765 [Nitrososphaerales archaeon]|nr:hypothetical protein [Nitrososphaerales archaeon]
MAPKARTLEQYLRELEKTKKGKPEQVEEALEIYLDLWKRAIKRGVVLPADEVGAALTKVEESGGLYKAAGD